MLKRLLTSTLALGILTGAAVANSNGLTPGAPLGEDPLSGGKVVVGGQGDRQIG